MQTSLYLDERNLRLRFMKGRIERRYDNIWSGATRMRNVEQERRGWAPVVVVKDRVSFVLALFTVRSRRGMAMTSTI